MKIKEVWRFIRNQLADWIVALGIGLVVAVFFMALIYTACGLLSVFWRVFIGG